MASASVAKQDKEELENFEKEMEKLDPTTDYDKGLQMIAKFGAKKAWRSLKVFELNMIFLKNKKLYAEAIQVGTNAQQYGHKCSVSQAKVLGFCFKELQQLPYACVCYAFVCNSDVEDKDLYQAELDFMLGECKRLGQATPVDAALASSKKSVVRKNKKELKKFEKQLEELDKTNDFERGLQLIEDFGAEEARHSLKVYEMNLVFLRNTKRYQEAIDLGIVRAERYGHQFNSFQAKILGFCCKEIGDFVGACKCYAYVCDSDDVMDKDIYKAQLNILKAKCESSSINTKKKGSKDICKAQLNIQKAKCESLSINTKKKALEDVVQVAPGDDVDKDQMAVDACPQDVDVGSKEIEASPQDNVDEVEKRTKFGTMVSFDMKCIYDICFEGVVMFGNVSLKKGFIKCEDEHQVKYFLDKCNSRPDKKNKTIAYLLNVDFVFQSLDAPYHFLAVEPVNPLLFFFKKKLDSFNELGVASDSKRGWWEYIEESYRSIFRDILCCVYAIHSRNEIVNDVKDKLYVTTHGEGKILYWHEREYSLNKAKEDVNDILYCMKMVITSFKESQDRKLKLEDWKTVYGIPHELAHLFKYYKRSKLPSTWIIDHPFIWDTKARINFIKFLNDVFREVLIDEKLFATCLKRKEDYDWTYKVDTDPLLQAIYDYKGDKVYKCQAGAQLVHFMHAFYSHANDPQYDSVRGSQHLTPYVMEGKLAQAFPDVYIKLFDAMRLYSVQDNVDVPGLLVALDRFSSLKLNIVKIDSKNK